MSIESAYEEYRSRHKSLVKEKKRKLGLEDTTENFSDAELV